MSIHLSPSPDVFLHDAVQWLAHQQKRTLRRSSTRSSSEFREFRRLLRLSVKQMGNFEPFPSEAALTDPRSRANPRHVIQLVSALPRTRQIPHRRALLAVAEKLAKGLEEEAAAMSAAWQPILEACVAGRLALKGRKADERRFHSISVVENWNGTWPPSQILEWEKVILDRVAFQRWAAQIVKRPRGRISRFAWSDFHAVAHEKLRNNQRWTNTALKIEMTKWCAANWKVQPASITIMQQIAKIFKGFEAANDPPQ
jgi:hypothetical protein